MTMPSDNARRKGESNGWGMASLAVVVLVIGGLFLYQREGGKLFGPEGLAKKVLPADPTVKGITAEFDTGLLSHDLLLKNEYSGGDLSDVEVVVTLFREDGQKPQINQFWGTWKRDEIKRISMTAHPYQKVQLKGTAKKAGEAVRIETEWSWSWSRNPPSGRVPSAAGSGPRVVEGIKAQLSGGGSGSALELVNGFNGGVLRNVRCTVALIDKTGGRQERPLSLEVWSNNETITVAIPSGEYKSIRLTGTATSAKQGWEHVTFDTTWVVN